MNIAKLKRFLLSLTIIFLLFFGCFLDSPTSSYGLAELNIGLQQQSRTIIYNLTQDSVEQLRIDFISGPAEMESQIFSFNEQLLLHLLPGMWNAEISGLNSSGQEIVFSAVEFSLAAYESTSVNIELEPLLTDTTESEASGYVDITVDWSGAGSAVLSEVDSMSAEFGVSGGILDDVTSGLTVNTAAGTAVFSVAPCISGNFIFRLNLANVEGLVISTVSEAVNVRDNLGSSGVINLSAGDFNLNGITLNISVDLPPEQDISFSYEDGHIFTLSEIAVGVSVSVVCPTVYDGYFWSLYGYAPASVTDTVQLPLDLSVGVYQLTVFTESDGDLFSETLRFAVRQ